MEEVPKPQEQIIDIPDEDKKRLTLEFMEDFKQLSPLNQIRLLAGIYKVELNDEPKKNCGHCYGTGFAGKYADSDIPIICQCLIKNPHQMAIKRNREHKRRIAKAQGKFKRK